MKQYPKILHWNNSPLGLPCIAFDKLDGSNIRFEYSRKRGWYKSGSRKMMIDSKHEDFGHAIKLFEDRCQENLSKIFCDNKQFRGVKNFVVFCEYFGDNSFAGWHAPDDPMYIVLFDVWLMRKGFVTPRDFTKIFGDKLEIPSVIYEGNFNRSFIQKVSDNGFNLKEGIVAKGILKKAPPGRNVWMTKVKTQEWLLKVKGKYGEDRLKEELE